MYQKLYKLDSFLTELLKKTKWGRFLRHSVYTKCNNGDSATKKNTRPGARTDTKTVDRVKVLTANIANDIACNINISKQF